MNYFTKNHNKLKKLTGGSILLYRTAEGKCPLTRNFVCHKCTVKNT